MPRFILGTSADLVRLADTSNGHRYRQPFRDALQALQPGATLELSPEGGESLRKLKVNLRRSANEINVSIAYGETSDGTVLVWLKEARKTRAA